MANSGLSLRATLVSGVLLCGVITALLIALWTDPAPARPGGVEGHSGNPGLVGEATCSECHSGGIGEPFVTITSPATVTVGETTLATVTISGGPGVVGGFNASFDDFLGRPIPTDGETREAGLEITHSAPKPFENGQVSFTFAWTPPADTGSIALYAAGLSANGNGNLLGDSVGTAVTVIEIVDPTPATPTPTPTATPEPTATPVASSTPTPTPTPTATPTPVATGTPAPSPTPVTSSTPTPTATPTPTPTATPESTATPVASSTPTPTATVAPTPTLPPPSPTPPSTAVPVPTVPALVSSSPVLPYPGPFTVGPGTATPLPESAPAQATPVDSTLDTAQLTSAPPTSDSAGLPAELAVTAVNDAAVATAGVLLVITGSLCVVHSRRRLNE